MTDPTQLRAVAAMLDNLTDDELQQVETKSSSIREVRYEQRYQRVADLFTVHGFGRYETIEALCRRLPNHAAYDVIVEALTNLNAKEAPQ